ncbi:ion transporter [Candidatus Neomarinimicrobiota bacterium]
MSLKEIINNPYTPKGKAFVFFVQSLIIISLVSFTVETIPNLNQQTVKLLNIFEVITVIIFSIEYLLRILVADNKIKYITSFYGLIDIIAILPFYLTTGVDLRSIRIFRLFRLFRIFKLLRFSTAFDRIKQAFIDVKNELLIFFVAMAFVLYVSAVGIYYFENPAQPEQFKSVIHCFWWAITTLTTVGYGDMYPITVGGKIFTSLIIIIGIGIVAVPTGLLASALTKTKK